MVESSLRRRLRAALPAAMKSRDRTAVAALRGTLAAIDNAEAVAPAEGTQRGQAIEQVAIGAGATDVARRELTDDDVLRIVRAEVDEREAAALTYEQSGRTDRAEQLRSEAAVLAAHLTATTTSNATPPRRRPASRPNALPSS